MFVKLEIVKKKEYWLLSLLSSVLTAVLANVLGVSLTVSVVIGLLLLAVLTLRLHFDESTPVWMTALIGALFSFIIYTEVQFAVGTSITGVSFIKMLLNWMVVYGLVLLITVACGYLHYALIAVQALVVLLGIANHMVVQARGMEMQFADLLSIGTAMDVAGNYTFTLSARTIGAIFFALLVTLFLCINRLPRLRAIKLRVGGLAVSTAALSLAVLLITTSWGSELIGYQQRFWQIQATTQNGFIVNFIRSISAAKVSRPSGYSKDTLQALLTEYIDQLDRPQASGPAVPDSRPSDGPTDSDEQKRPNIIVVMNETFADLASISEYQGKQMQANTDLLPYFSSLSDDASNIAKGYAMASVFGGNTANSEFEFLTGHSMAFLPLNTVAYNSSVNQNNAFSVVDILNKSGYQTVGMHPGPVSNWNRGNLYSYFGFDQCYFLESHNGAYESFVSDEPLRAEDYYREYVSDSTVYDRIIELYEQKEEGTPLFTFAITMQNHGGYTYMADQFDFTVQLDGKTGSSSVEEYLSSVQNSDAALQELIAYFEEAEEETLIVFFGDHQPSLPNEFYAEYFGLDDVSSTEAVQAKYAVPYLYWANYDFESEFGEITSLNYLSSHMLEIAGVEKTDYLKFTDLVEKEIIAINAFGWWDTQCVFHSFSEESSDDVNLLQLYEYLQYNALFDDAEDKLVDWFVMPDRDALLPMSETTGESRADGSSDEDPIA